MKPVLFLLLVALVSPVLAAETVAFDKPSDLDRWQIEVGKWAVQDGALLHSDASAHRSLIWSPAQAYSDVDLTVDFYIHPDGSGVRAPGIVYRAVDQITYYYLHFDYLNKQVVWVRSDSAKEWTDARRHRTEALKTGEWMAARVVCKGDTHEVYLNGKLLFTEKDATIPAGVIGLRAGQGKIAFRNLRVEGTPATLEKPFVVTKPPYGVVCSDAGAGAYEAFPDLCRTRSGELLCVFYAGYSHVSVPTAKLPKGARIAMCRSTDDGKTWSPAETVVDTPIDDRDPSITQLANGDLLCVYMSYDPTRKPGTHQVFTIRASDDGKTWSEPARVPTPLTGNEAVSTPVVPLADGRLLLPVYGQMLEATKPPSCVAVLESRDLGKTWESLSLVRSKDSESHEPCLLPMPDGRLLMLIRPTMTSCESTDGGKTWTEPKPIGVQGDAPYLLLTSKNLLLCAFRHRPTASTCVIYSRDFGRTWSDMVTLDRVLGAYPSMVELPDGRILVVYYTEGSGSDIRCLYLRADDSGVQVLPRD